MSVISFFSYKGGSGRTTTTLNTLYYLIQETKPTAKSPLIIIDADSESYGMSMLIRDTSVSYPPDVSLQGLGVRAQQNVFVPSGDPTDWRSYERLNKFFIPVGNYFTKDVENEAVLLLRSDVTPAEQSAAFGGILFSLSAPGGNEEENLTEALDIMRRCHCNVVFDTPAGTQDMATFSLNNSETIVCCMRPSVQFEMGTRLCFDKLMMEWYEVRNRKNIIFCPSAVPFRETKVDEAVYPAHYRATLYSRFRDAMETRANDTRGVIRLIWGMEKGDVPGIPEVERFKWQECCLGNIKSDKEDEQMAKDKYRLLAQLVSRSSNG